LVAKASDDNEGGVDVYPNNWGGSATDYRDNTLFYGNKNGVIIIAREAGGTVGIYVNGPENTNQVMWITAQGNVGIGQSPVSPTGRERYFSIMPLNNQNETCGLAMGNGTRSRYELITSGSVISDFNILEENTNRISIAGQTGYVGIGGTNSAYQLGVKGDIHCTGKLTSDGGNDPPYLLLDRNTITSVWERITREVPPSKLTGYALFIDHEHKKLLALKPSTGKVFDIMDGSVFTNVTAITTNELICSYTWQYWLDPLTGNVCSNEIRVPFLQWAIKDGYVLNPTNGLFYTQVGATNVPKAEALHQVLKP
jgi:hypothetical protein